MFTFTTTNTFVISRTRLIENNEQLQRRLKTALQKLATNPLHPSLRSHKVDAREYGVRWSSWVTGDIRVIWDYDHNQRLVILLLDIGGHSGSHKVYI